MVEHGRKKTRRPASFFKRNMPEHPVGAPAPASDGVNGVGCGAAPPLAGWLLAAWLPACVTVQL